VRSAELRDPSTLVISSMTGRPYIDAQDAARSLVVALTGCVDWPRTVEGLRSAGADTLFEGGPKTTLRDLSLTLWPEADACSCGEAGGLAAAVVRLAGPGLPGAAAGPLDRRSAVRVLQAFLRTAVGTPTSSDLAEAEIDLRIRRPYLQMCAELDSVRTGASSARAAVDRAEKLLRDLLTAKGTDPLWAGSALTRARQSAATPSGAATTHTH